MLKRELNEDPRSWPSDNPDRWVHHRIRSNIEAALDGRSWTWLAEEIGIPQSTLSGQVCKPKFSLGVVLRISGVLGIGLCSLTDHPCDRITDSR